MRPSRTSWQPTWVTLQDDRRTEQVERMEECKCSLFSHALGPDKSHLSLHTEGAEYIEHRINGQTERAGAGNLLSLRPLAIWPLLLDTTDSDVGKASVPFPVPGEGKLVFPKDPCCHCSGYIMNNSHSSPRMKSLPPKSA